MSEVVKIDRLVRARIFGVRDEPDAVVLKLVVADGQEFNIGMTVDGLADLAARMATDAKFLKMPVIEGAALQ